MDELSHEVSERLPERVNEPPITPTGSGPSPGNAGAELRKRRSTRIVQAVPLAVTGVDAIGRTFTEHTSSLIINCHGCRFQSKHYVLKNMWVKLEVPHPEAGHAPRHVRGRVAWIQRPRTVRQLFQVALELETPGNIWGIAFPPEDWFAFPEVAPQNHQVGTPGEHQAGESEREPITAEHEPFAGITDNVRAFPSPASTTDASLQLARQVARLVADAKQQIQAAAREAATQAVAAEQRASFEQWEQKFAVARQEVTNETSRMIEKIQQEAEQSRQAANAAAAEAVRAELPRQFTPQFEQMTSDLTARLTREGLAQRDRHIEQLKNSGEKVLALFQEAEEVANRLKTQASQIEARLQAESEKVAQTREEAAKLHAETGTNLAIQAEETEAHIASRAEAAARTMEEAAHVREEALGRLKAHAAQTEADIKETTARAIEETTRAREALLASSLQTLRTTAEELQQQVTASIANAHQEREAHLASEIEQALNRWHNTVEKTLPEAQFRAIGELETRVNGLFARLQEEVAAHGKSLKNQASEASTELEQRTAGLRGALQESTERLEFALGRAGESSNTLEHFSTRLGVLHEQALVGFHTQLDDVLSLHRNELHRRSEAVFEDIAARIRTSFEEGGKRATEEFQERIESIVGPQIQRTEDSVHRMAGGRSLLDAALSMQQDRIRTAADDAFAEALSRFRDNLGSAEQLLDEASRTVTTRSLSEMEEKLSGIRDQIVQDVSKSAEWYEKKAQTHIQSATEKAVEQAGSVLREKAGEISSMFTSELDNSSRNFVGHTQSQMEDTVREAFERARALFSEASETTSAAFTDEIQRTGRLELEGFGDELQKTVEYARTELDGARREVSQRVTVEQEEFLRRFQTAMDSALEHGVNDAQAKVEASFSPLLDSWKYMTNQHQSELHHLYNKISEQATEQHRTRLENVSNQWLLATVSSLDRQAREAVASISATAEQQLHETCTRVFEGIGETLQERLQQIARNLAMPPEQNTRSRSATT
jgi:hypothetical protein